jgi:phytoene synthase
VTVEQSYRYAVMVSRQRARNFYYSFLLLPAPKRKAICAIYAFMRYCDDLSDDIAISDRRQAIARWKSELENALDGRFSGHPVWPAFHDAVTRYNIPHQYFFEMIEGVSSDLGPRSIGTFEELYGYCYRVASVVGLTIVHIFGVKSPEALQYAESCGIAFQLTNILRDIREDALLGRVYLPAEDLARFGVDPADFRHGGEISQRFTVLMRWEAIRARRYYQASAPLIDLIEEGSRASLWALIEIYRRLLDRIESANYDVLNQRVTVPAREKAWIVVRAFAGALRRGDRVPPARTVPS